MENNKKKKIMLGVIVGVLVLTLAGSFALWAYSKIGQNQLLVAGDVYMKYTGTNNINVTNATPSDTYNKSDYFEFTVEGKNTYKKDIIYDIVLDQGAEPTGEGNENRTERIKDKFLKFRLVKVTGEDSEEELIQEGNYESIIEKRIWVDRISANTTSETSTKYRLYVWISSDIKIGLGDGIDYEMDTWNNNVYASIKVTVTGDFAEKGLEDGEEPTLELNEQEGTIEPNGETTFTVTANTEGTFSAKSDEPSIATASVMPETGTMTTVTVNAIGTGTTNIKVNFKPKSAKYKETTTTYSITVGEKLLDKINEKIDDFNSINDGETTFLSGTNDQINFNYVWYSGKLWRITSINSDNTMKMITQDTITAIDWGADITYKDSWIYQWLNEDFLDTLENQENVIVQNAKWNATNNENKTPSKPTEETMVEGNVGLLNAYEHSQSYKNIGADYNAYGSGYLNIRYQWWLITSQYNLSIHYVVTGGDLGNSSPSSDGGGFGVRPCINLKSDILVIGGKGTQENPYRISGDKSISKINDKLNSRVSGEYVNFDGKKYRIVGIENDTTKLTSVDYIRDVDNTIMKKDFGSSNNWIAAVASDSDDKYWSYYLNNTWYNSINEMYKNMLVDGTYYLGKLNAGDYKNSICSDNDTTETTKKCRKTSSTWTGKVGLPRVGEMFSAMIGKGSTDTNTGILLITPYSNSSYIRYIANTSDLSAYPSPSSFAWGVRPSINLNSNVVITGGEGTEQKPYEIKCDSCS